MEERRRVDRTLQLLISQGQICHNVKKTSPTLAARGLEEHVRVSLIFVIIVSFMLLEYWVTPKIRLSKPFRLDLDRSKRCLNPVYLRKILKFRQGGTWFLP